MIIECTNCNKKFNVDSNLIPINGREIICGSCNFKWFYELEKTSTHFLALDKQSNQDDAKLNIVPNIILENDFKNKSKEEIIEDKDVINSEDSIDSFSNEKIKIQNKNKYFSYLLVFIVSFVALIIVLDTFKLILINIFPGLELLLFNLFESFMDIKLFIIDLT